MPTKALTIDVNSNAIPTGSLDAWSPLDSAKFINNIITPELSEDTNVGELVSGIPTAFARVDLFRTALDYVGLNRGGNEEANGKNLISYYSALVDEWKGLIACMALDYQHITVRSIDMAYSDGNDTATTANIYEPKGAFGNMLMLRRSRWLDQSKDDSNEQIPYINIIKYHDQVVGATSPESLVFTSTGYKCEKEDGQPWINYKTGKFTDPMNYAMTDDQIGHLYAYVCYLLNGLTAFEDYFIDLKDNEGVSFTSIRTILEKWKAQIEAKAVQDNIDLTRFNTPPVTANFRGPYHDLFCYVDLLFGSEGIISSSMLPGGIKFDPKDLLLDESARIAQLSLDIDPEDIADLPILVLTATAKGDENKPVKDRAKYYFALPFSALGLNVFGKNIATLVGMGGESSLVKSSLKATYDESLRNGNLEVVLDLVTREGTSRQFKKVYTSDGGVQSKDILIWPNFVSQQWDAYYMYNELPHNEISGSYRAFPFVGRMEDNEYFRIIVDNETMQPVLLSQDGQIVVPKDVIDAEIVVESNSRVSSNYKYEIYRSKLPFKGVRLLSPTGKEGGYLLIRYSSETNTDSKLPHDWMLPDARPGLQDVRVGIDFGSTNTSIAYSSDNTQEQGFTFENQRVSLMGRELHGKPVMPRENEVLFFPGAGTSVLSNSIKSVLTIHHHNRLPKISAGQDVRLRNSKEVVGGFPCFADDLPFKNSNSERITLHYPEIEEITQIHNMKWEETDESKAYKNAFLRTLMLQVYATLFAKGYVPNKLKWSYPSSMGLDLMHKYREIWDSLAELQPVSRRTGNDYNKVALQVSEASMSPGIRESVGFGTGSFEQEAPQTTTDSFGTENSFGGGFGGGFGNDFGTTPSQSVAKPVSDEGNDEEFMPDDQNREVVYNPQPIYDPNDDVHSHSLSEAEAVANYIASKHSTGGGQLNLCFDVGGSTTDISALYRLNRGVTMIKQNSIRFAAQLVSQSVSRFPKFRTVLQNVCAKYGIKMVGLNIEPLMYNESTAPYFFDQIVNKLNNEQLQDLYRQIAANCPQLMYVNMYVTGLLMFYAGQQAHKLVNDLFNSKESGLTAGMKPLVRITFAGKGSRLFQWLETINASTAREYYNGMFLRGYGEANPTRCTYKIELPDLDNNDIKYEVSKGLAKGDTQLYRPADSTKSEIIGETGFDIVGNDNVRRPLDFTNTITPKMMRQIGIRLTPDFGRSQGDKFTMFCGYFYAAAKHIFGWGVNPAKLEQECRDLEISAFIENHSDFRRALNNAGMNGEFNFVTSIIIFEGMKFYNKLLDILSKEG